MLKGLVKLFGALGSNPENSKLASDETSERSSCLSSQLAPLTLIKPGDTVDNTVTDCDHSASLHHTDSLSEVSTVSTYRASGVQPISGAGENI